MRVLERSVYVGPSQYAHFPVIRLELDLQALEAWPTGKLGAAFVDGLVAALPGLADHGCSYREPGGFIRRMREGEGTWLGHVLEHVAIELQNVAGEDVTFGKTRSVGDDRPGVYTVVYEYAQKEEGIAAGELAIKLLSSLLPVELRPKDSVPEDWDWDTARDDFIRYAQRRALGPSTASLVRAAEERGIPWLRLNQQSLIQFGHGKYQQRIQATVTGKTPCNVGNQQHLGELIEQYAPQGVEFYALQKPGSHGQLPENLRHMKVLDALPGADQIPASPAVGIWDRTGKLAYFGPYSEGLTCNASNSFIEPILKALGTGREVNATHTLAVGCYCSWPKDL